MKPFKVNVVMAVIGNELEAIHVFADRNKAREKRDELAKAYGLEGKEYLDCPHGKACRCVELDENSVHLHKVKVE